MAVKQPPKFTPPPLKPQRGDRSTFAPRVDGWISWNIDSVDEFAAMGQNVADNAADAATSAQTATGAAAAASVSADSAGSSAGKASVSEKAAAASAGLAAQSAAAAQGTQVIASSSSNVQIGIGDKDFEIEAGKQFALNVPVIAVDVADASRFISGVVKSYVGTKLQIAASAFGGAGNGSAWNISLSGVRGLKGDTGIAGATVKRQSRTQNALLVAADSQSLIDVVSGAFDQTFDAASTLGNGWYVWYRNSGDGNLTLKPNGNETIDGMSSFVSYPGETRLIQSDGVALRSYVINPFRKVFLSSGTFVRPPGYKAFGGYAWGAGGGRGSGDPYIGKLGFDCGAGAACVPFYYAASAIAANEPVLVGAGGPPGGIGGNTTFSGTTAYGGGSGSGGIGGAGGGMLGAGAISPGAPVTGVPAATMQDGQLGGAYGANSSGSYGAGRSVYGGAGGGAGNGAGYSWGGNSVYGGGGGSSAVNPSSSYAGGKSTFGGQGGRGGGAALVVSAVTAAGFIATSLATFTGSGLSAGDLGLIIVGSAHPNDAIPDTPAGWTLVGSSSGGVGAFAVQSGLRRVTVFSKVLTGAETSVAVTGAGFTDSITVGYLVKPVNGQALSVAYGAGVKNAAGTLYSTQATSVDVAPDDLLLAITVVSGAVQQDNNLPVLSLPGATLSELVPNGGWYTTATNYASLIGWSARVATGTVSSNLTYTMTLSATAANSPAGVTAVLRLRGAAHSIDGQQPGGGCGGLGNKGGDGAVHIWGVV